MCCCFWKVGGLHWVITILVIRFSKYSKLEKILLVVINFEFEYR